MFDRCIYCEDGERFARETHPFKADALVIKGEDDKCIDIIGMTDMHNVLIFCLNTLQQALDLYKIEKKSFCFPSNVGFHAG